MPGALPEGLGASWYPENWSKSEFRRSRAIPPAGWRPPPAAVTAQSNYDEK